MCIFVDNGLLRLDEEKEIEEMFRKNFALNFNSINAKLLYVGIFHRDNRLFFELFCCVPVDLGGGLCSALSGTYEAKETQGTHHYVCEVSRQYSFFFPSFRVFICFFVLGFLGCKNEDWEE